MKRIILVLIVNQVLVYHSVIGQIAQESTNRHAKQNVDALKDTLEAIANRTDNELFKLSCESMLNVINDQPNLTLADENLLSATYEAFIDVNTEGSPYNVESYLLRQRSFILAWYSPTDGSVSFSWLKLPENWEPGKAYPLYVQLHGFWNVADYPIEYMTYPYRNGPSSTYAFNNGYLLSPWGRGNFWYEGISETDIWECIEAFERVDEIQIIEDKKYLCGHSMGGYGAWNLGQKTANTWAAIGIHAGALWYGSTNLVTTEVAENLSQTPVYFVCGTNDGLLNVNLSAYDLLEEVGNTQIEFVTFEGGHEYRSEDVERMYDWMLNIALPVEESPNIYDNYKIQISPNPCRNQANIEFNLSNIEYVRIEFFNSMGQSIALVFDSNLTQGHQSVIWKPSHLEPGIYYCSIKIGGHSTCNKVLLY